jgi:hypothetical protein
MSCCSLSTPFIRASDWSHCCSRFYCPVCHVSIVRSTASLSDNPLIYVPKLRHLTLAKAYPLDRIFHHLTDKMFLSLPATIPLRENWMQWCKQLHYLPTPASSTIFWRCTVSNITEFHMSINRELPPTLLSEATHALPFLEIRTAPSTRSWHYRIFTSVWIFIQPGHDVCNASESYASAFLEFLRHIDLDWPLTNVADPDEYSWEQRTNSPRIDMEKFMIRTAKCQAGQLPAEERQLFARHERW